MHIPSLDRLFLTEAELQIARGQIQEMAYYKWQNAGSPVGDADRFWSEAELEWIEYCYVPHREFDPPTTDGHQTSKVGFRRTP